MQLEDFVLLAYVPASHSRQVDEMFAPDAEEYFPDVHEMQSEEELFPVVFRYDPASQRRQEVAAESDEYFPASHVKQNVCPVVVPYWPKLHETQFDNCGAPSAVEKVLLGHTVHEVCVVCPVLF